MTIRVVCSAFFITVLSFTSNCPSRQLSPARARAFVDALVSRDPNLPSYVFPEELKVSKRLGIDFKFLVAYDLDASIREGVKSGNLRCDIRISDGGDDFSILELDVAGRASPIGV
jgi:hypothetical protein